MKRLSALIHGTSGVGKSPLLDTAPGPRLILDAEGGTDDTPSRKIPWDPAHPIPTDLGPDDSVVVTVRSWADVVQVQAWLSTGNHPFESVCWDSITEIQARLKDTIGAAGDFQQRQWGQLLDQMTLVVRQFRDLTFHPTKPIHLFISALTVDKDGEKQADVQGALGRKLPSYMKVVGYLGTSVEEAGLVRRLLIQPLPGFQAKDRTTTLTARFGNSILVHGTEDAHDLAALVAVYNSEEEV